MVTLQRLHSGTGRYNLYLPLVKACLLPALSAMLAKNTFILSTRIFCRRDFKYFLSLSDLANRYWAKKCKLYNTAWAKQISTNKQSTQTAERHPLISAVSGRNFAIWKLFIRVFQLGNKNKATSWCGCLQINLCTWVLLNYIRDALPLFIKHPKWLGKLGGNMNLPQPNCARLFYFLPQVDRGEAEKNQRKISWP